MQIKHTPILKQLQQSFIKVFKQKIEMTAIMAVPFLTGEKTCKIFAKSNKI